MVREVAYKSPPVVLATAAIIALLSMANAHADDNFSNIAQTGDRNTVLIDQSAGSGNSAGATGLALRQSGDDNRLMITQSGEGNRIGARGAGFLQQSNRSTADITQSSNNNVVREVIQTGIASGAGAEWRNALSITQKGGDGNVVRRVDQTRAGGLLGLPGQPGNETRIVQDGARNVVGLLSQTGLRNSADLSFAGNRNRADAVQAGVGNELDVTVRKGNRNRVRIDQHSLAFGNSARLDITHGNRNSARIDQSGTNAAVVSITGSYNLLTLAQTGSGEADILIEGDRNVLRAEQTGAGNALSVSIRGDDTNMKPSFATEAPRALASRFRLAPGDIVQTGAGNSIDYRIGRQDILSSSNSFAFLQQGLGNRIVGESIGDDNEVVIVQRGTLNFTSFVQIGSGNVIAVNQ